MLKHPLFAAILAVACATSYANNCDDLKAQIESKIKAAGVASFTVTVVDTAANASGKVVGSCDKGARKIMYLQNTTTSAATGTTTPPTAAASSAKPSASAAARQAKSPTKIPNAGAILTECKDGSSSLGGTCKK